MQEMSARARTGRIAAVTVAAFLAGFPAQAAAQKAAFLDAFVTFHSRLIGTFGDEGPQIAAAVDEMAAGLAEWDRQAGVAEASASAPGDRAVINLDRGRFDLALKALDAAIQAEPGRAAFHRLRGLVLEALGREDEALASLAAAWDLDRSDPMTAYLLADRRAAHGGTEDVAPQAAALAATYARTGGPPPGRAPAPFTQLALVADRAADTPIFSPALYDDGFALVAQ